MPFSGFAALLGERASAAGSPAFDKIPSSCEVGLAGRQRPDCVEMVGQNADGDGFEWPLLLDGAIDVAQAIDVTNEKIAGAIGERHGEEECAA